MLRSCPERGSDSDCLKPRPSHGQTGSDPQRESQAGRDPDGLRNQVFTLRLRIGGLGSMSDMAILQQYLGSNCGTSHNANHEQRNRRYLHNAYQPFRSPVYTRHDSENHADRGKQEQQPKGEDFRVFPRWKESGRGSELIVEECPSSENRICANDAKCQ